MNGNAPYLGRSTDDNDDAVELSAETRRALQTRVSGIAARTRTLLPDEYVVGSSVGTGTDGLRVTVSVRPPIGNPVSAGFAPDLDGDDLLPEDDVDEVAHGLAASAALQVKRAMGEDVAQTAR